MRDELLVSWFLDQKIEMTMLVEGFMLQVGDCRNLNFYLVT